MIIWVCDQCGHRVEKQRIVGNEFAYCDAGFKSLALPVDGKQDLCKPCMKKAIAAACEFDKKQNTSRWDAIKAALHI